MPSSINNSDLTNQLEDVLRSFVKEKLELIMREELTNFLHVEKPDASNSRNGYYQRSLETRYGKIENLTVLRDREGAFQTAPASQQDGYRDILGFYVGGQESASGWRDILLDLYNRALYQVLLGVFDGLGGLEDAFHDVYPKADVQRCVIHKVHNTLNKVRKKDQYEIAEDMKAIYRSLTTEAALVQFEAFQKKWASKYPREVASWEQDLPVLLTFLSYPSSIRGVIYTTNWIERTNKEIRKRLKPMNSLSNLKAAEKIVYLSLQDLQERWSTRKFNGKGKIEATVQEIQRLKILAKKYLVQNAKARVTF
ncbi:transposase [Aneurinibacillus sp. Ricciae_BoGa-3]|uniref:IS256 family transposase n=1 Tax=Aneurinibacillus sp. Ricciae_BoGa-3 TaxID=3022697 RepID=UPI0023422C4A|nr:transposase [Aneurinibacillus sp. Ricciae_BoGa-3]WCK54466.1 transposase [Aneurinibacillus sp. Ricciae_BoGa-3]